MTEYSNYDERNVVDRFKGMEPEAIRTALRDSASPFQAWFVNLTGDFNKATGVRNANAFNAEQVCFFGNKKWDRRGAVGTHNYTPVNVYPYEDLLRMIGEAKVNGYRIIAVDNVFAAQKLNRTNWIRYDRITDMEMGPIPCIFIFGEEGAGLSADVLDNCDYAVYIPQLGSVRSLNVGTASGIIFYDFVSKIGLI
jgi:tRNA G18 (ribose-2'-O)-methylase SpoU